MNNARKISITNIPEISAIYYALLQCGYDFYSIGRCQEHIDAVRGFTDGEAVPFFFGVRQNTCEVYPYWPRAAILETASFYLQPDHSRFREYEVFRERILSAGNVADYERDQKFWDWMAGFPTALSEVLGSDAFHGYLEWENKWIAGQNIRHETELQLIQSCLDRCVEKYSSPVQDIRIVINPIKCVCSADYHLNGDCFIFCSGAFQTDYVIHEFLHHVVHPVAAEIADMVLASKRVWNGIDNSYYLSGNDAGRLNAFEEYAVRKLTKSILNGKYPDALLSFLRELI